MNLLGLILNILVVGLLCVCIAYCWALNRRIKILQDSKSELAQLLKHFDESTQRASESIIALQTASKKIGENIQFRIEKANYLLEDLAYMIERGNKLTNHIEAGFAVDRARSRVQQSEVEVKPTPVQHQQVEREAPPAPVPVSLREIAQPAARPSDKSSAREKTAASLEALLERVVGRTKTPMAEPEEEAPITVRQAQARAARSRSEQELLAMLKTGIKG